MNAASIHNMDDINPEALLITIQNLMNAVSGMKTEIESLRNNVAEALGILVRKSATREAKTTRRFKIYRNKIKMMETSIRILQERMNSSFMEGPQFNEHYCQTRQHSQQHRSLECHDAAFVSPISGRSWPSPDSHTRSSQHAAENRRMHDLLVGVRFGNQQLSEHEIESRRKALEVARRRRKRKQFQTSNETAGDKEKEAANHDLFASDDENDSTDDCDDDNETSSPPPPSASSPSRSPPSHPRKSASPTTITATPPVLPSPPTPTPSPTKRSAPVFVPILGSDVALVGAAPAAAPLSSSSSCSLTPASSCAQKCLGVVVVRVPLGSALHSSGVQVGDRIVEVNGLKIENGEEDLVRLVKMTRPAADDPISSAITICVVPSKTAQKIQANLAASATPAKNYADFAKQAIRLSLPLSPSSSSSPTSALQHRHHPYSHQNSPVVLHVQQPGFNGAAANRDHLVRQSSVSSTPRWH